MKAIVEGGSELMYGATFDNDAVDNLSDEDLMFMEILNKPKAKSTLLILLKRIFSVVIKVGKRKIKRLWLRLFILN